MSTISSNIKLLIDEATDNYTTGRFSNAATIFEDIAIRIADEDTLDWIYFLYRSMISSKKADDVILTAKNMLNLHRQSIRKANQLMRKKLEETSELVEKEKLLYQIIQIELKLENYEEAYAICQSAMQIYEKLGIQNDMFEGNYDYISRYLDVASKIGNYEVINDTKEKIIDAILSYIIRKEEFYLNNSEGQFIAASFILQAMKFSIEIFNFEKTRILFDNLLKYPDVLEYAQFAKYGLKPVKSTPELEEYINALQNLDLNNEYNPSGTYLIDVDEFVTNDNKTEIEGLKLLIKELETQGSIKLIISPNNVNRFTSPFFFEKYRQEDRLIELDLAGKYEYHLPRIAIKMQAFLVSNRENIDLITKHVVKYAVDEPHVFINRSEQ